MYLAGCSIKPRYTICYKEEVPEAMGLFRLKNEFSLSQELCDRKNLRQEILALAILHGDLQIIKKLHGREIPNLDVFSIDNYMTTFQENYSSKMIDVLASPELKNTEIIDYFSEEYEFELNMNRLYLIFPYTKTWIEEMIKNKSDHLITVIERVIKHHQLILKKVEEISASIYHNIYDKNMKIYVETGYPELDNITRDRVRHDLLQKSIKETEELIRKDSDSGIMTVFDRFDKSGCFITYIFNCFQIDVSDQDKDFRSLPQEVKTQINHLNDTYHKIFNYRPSMAE